MRPAWDDVQYMSLVYPSFGRCNSSTQIKFTMCISRSSFEMGMWPMVFSTPPSPILHHHRTPGAGKQHTPF